MTARRKILLALVGVVAVYAAFAVWERRWTCDDAFISYRYAKNLAEGRGLVFNAGERVEGYTNFLHTVGLAAAIAAGIDPRSASMFSGAVSYFAVAAILVWWSFRRGRTIPVAAILWLVQDDLHTWATGGLETTMFTAFALGGIGLCVVPDVRTPRTTFFAGLLLSAACLTRPDGVLFALVAVVAAALERRPRALAALVAPLVVIGGTFAAWKLSYYGHLLPTAFRAKSAADAQFDQGLFYIGLYFAKHWSSMFALVALPLGALVTKRIALLRTQRAALVALAAFVTFAAYVAYTGGDYMFARRLVPALPFLFVVFEALLHALPDRVLFAGAGLVLAGALVPAPVLPSRPGIRVWGVADERLFYPESVIEARKRQGAVARDVFAGIPLKAAFGGGMCMFAYYSELPYLVEPNGLTQYWISDTGPVLDLVGHRGVALEELRAHGITLIFHHDLPGEIAPEPRFDEMLVGDVLRVEILTYDDALMAALARDPRVRFKRLDDLYREAETDMRAMTCGEARATFASLDAYVLASRPEPRARLRSVVEQVCAPR